MEGGSSGFTGLEGEFMSVLENHWDSDWSCPVQVEVGQLVSQVVPEIGWDFIIGIIVDHLESGWSSASLGHFLSKHEPVEDVFFNNMGFNKQSISWVTKMELISLEESLINSLGAQNDTEVNGLKFELGVQSSSDLLNFFSVDISDLGITDTISVKDDIGWAFLGFEDVSLDSLDDEFTEFVNNFSVWMVDSALVVL